MENFREEYARQYSIEVKELTTRYHNGEDYSLLQKELEKHTNVLIGKCFKYRIGDILTHEPSAEFIPVNYELDYCFNNIKYDLIIDYAYEGYDKGLNRIELLDVINREKHFINLFEGNYIFRSLLGFSKDWKSEIRATSETERYLTLKYDMNLNRIAYYIRSMIVLGFKKNYEKIHHIDYNITRKTDSQDLYFLKDEKGSIKIGISNDVIKRVSDLTSAMNQRIDIIKVFNNGGHLERILHKKFSHIREVREIKVDGYTEWFGATNELIEFIENFIYESKNK